MNYRGRLPDLTIHASHVLLGRELHITKNSRSFCHKKTDKTHSFAKRGRAKAQERRELETL